jgi:hypothetical protein
LNNHRNLTSKFKRIVFTMQLICWTTREYSGQFEREFTVKLLEKRLCHWHLCGKYYSPIRSDARFCCDACRWKAWDAAHPRKGVSQITTK